MSLFNNLSALFAKAQKKPQQASQVKSRNEIQTSAPGKPQPKKPSALKKTPQQKTQIKQEIDSSLREAKAKAREIIVEAKDQALEIKAQAEKQARGIQQKLTEQQQALERKIDKLDQKLDRIEQKEQRLDQQKTKISQVKTKVSKVKKNLLKRLEEISGMTKQEATQVLMDGLEKKLTQDMAQLVRQKHEEAKQQADDQVQEVLINAMRHGATDYVAEYTISVVKLPSEDVKGKIIGKSGRNINAFEKLTGVDVDLDYSDTEVRLSCFDPVRREIARVALKRLIKDGRIQPARIESTVNKVKKEIDKIMLEAGKDLCQRVGVYNLPHGLVKRLGRFKYRFSYGQNMVKHTLEETKIGVKIAQELNLDVNVVKIGCLLHDVGKVADTIEGNHVELGVKIAKK